MKTLEALQRDMATTTDLQEIVRTMKVLAAVSIRQYERAQESLQHYNRSVELGLQALLRQQTGLVSNGRKQVSETLGVIVFGSDHGLCGRYNESIASFTLQELDKWRQQERRILAVGSRVEAALRGMGQEVEDCFWVPGTVGHITGTVQKILLHIDTWQQQGIEQIMLFHHARRQRGSYPPEVRQLLPVDLGDSEHRREKTWPSRSLPQFTLNREVLLRALIKQHLFGLLFNACAESLAGEHASRLMSMQVAEKNIQQRQEDLTALYRQQRQDQITEELLDVVSGFEAMQEE
ncbi:F0F1 ATP synthase subunit gamma [Methylomarinum vadi]|uniref:F0F1 ATP synthase subunit gamma n=1 Tax=Methylomarinum vadi TaxID=438855 RepID=UPI0004DEFDEB|nr:F0F1 ATP synthase subunit gamma [Methylomarinum vadi]